MKFTNILIITILITSVLVIHMATPTVSAQEDSQELEKLKDAHYIISKLFGTINLDDNHKCHKWNITRAFHDFRITEIFYGKVTEISDGYEPNEKTVTINIQKKLLGDLPDNVNVTTSIAPCGMAFIIDREYLVYSMKNDQGKTVPFSMVLPPNEEPPAPGMPRSFAYNVEQEVKGIELTINYESTKKFNQYRDKIEETYNIITEWEKQNDVEITFGGSHVDPHQSVWNLGLSIDGNPDITKEDLKLLFTEIFGDINMNLGTSMTLIREGNDSVRGSNVSIKPPQIQLRDGIDLDEIKCKRGLELIFKVSDNSPACVKLSTAEKLIKRGWMVDNKIVSTP